MHKALKHFVLDHKHLFFRRTKIVATIGPSSNTEDKISELITRGLNVARINFSHGNPEDHVKTIQKIREISRKLNMPVAILGDLCGPKIRVGKFKNDFITLKEGSKVKIMVSGAMGDEGLIISQYVHLIEEVNENDRILLEDGKMELKVLGKLENSIEAIIIRGGILKNNKGMNLPDTKLRISALTEKDKIDAKYCIEAEVDYIALSFVQRPQDILDLKGYLASCNADIPIIAKIEKPEALENIHEIIEIADGIMVARGDLGVELPAEKIPIIQNELIKMANKQNKPVIVATQMLESMIENSTPTRAEVTDVAGACLAGADAVMLSAETAAGKYPVETLTMMDSILRETETHEFFASGGQFKKYPDEKKNFVFNAIGTATAQLSRDLMIRCVFVRTQSGFTARFVSSERPAAPIIVFTDSEKVATKLMLYWGVYPQVLDHKVDYNDFILLGEKTIKNLKLAKKGDFILIISGLGGQNIATNTIVIHRIN
jgi:pyruvate kinase